jgi:transcriptional regulator with XRE-family HTH domain
MHMARTLGTRIKNAREKQGLSQPQLGRKIGRCTATVYRWEADLVEPSFSTLRLVAAALRVPIGELVAGVQAA